MANLVGHQDGDEPVAVLIADCDRRVRQALRALLQTDPHLLVIAEVASVDELLTFANALRPSLVVLDILLPDAADGLQAIHDLTRSGNATLIVLSNATRWRQAALDAGAKIFLDKGINADLVLGVIANAACSPRPELG